MSLEHSPARDGKRSSESQPERRDTYTVNQFCASHNISRTALYQFWQEGRGPRYMLNGVRRLITAEGAAEWRRDREAEALSAAR
jgi:hypothetical protein